MKKFTLCFVLVLQVFIACKKTNNSPTEIGPNLTDNVDSISQMKVPNGFNYGLVKQVGISFQLDNSRIGDPTCRVDVYDGNPLSTGNLLISGLASNTKALLTSVSVATELDVLYFVVTSPDYSSTTTVVSANTDYVIASELGGLKKQVLRKSQPSSPDCNSGCTSTVFGNTNVNLNDQSAVICITGNFSGGIDINRGTVRICGNATVSNCNLNNNATLLIASGAVVTFSNININGTSATFRNWSSNVNISGTFSPGGRVDNYGNMRINGGFNLNGQAIVTNEGTLTVSQDFNNNKTLINNGTLTVQGSYNQNGGGEFTNSCRLTVGQNLVLNNPVQNNAYIAVTGNTTINGGGILNMINGAMFRTNNITINNIIAGTGNRSLVKVLGNTTINGGGRLNGVLQYCDQNGIETNFGQISNTVELACNLYIQTTSCNPEGNGSIQIPDTDNDGVNDSLDDYPTNPDYAFNNFYPTDSTFATVAFEDLWPSKGDFDLNDLVVDLRHNLITNASGKVARFEGAYRLRAAGGALKLAFCMQYPFNKTAVTNVNGATIEAAQDKLVLTLFENSKNELAFWNTVLTQPEVAPKNYSVSYNIPDGPSLASMGGVGAFDPFIWVNEASKGRGYEVHLPGKPNTPLANASLFGYADDDTQPTSKYYLSKNNLPWAILIPEEFTYCQELKMLPDPSVAVDITQVYLHFAQWAQSGGTIYQDWYMDKPGYRNPQYLYIR